MATCNFIDNPAPFPIYAMSGEDLEDDPRDMDEDDARGLWGLGRSAAVRALDSETGRLRAMLDRWAAGLGFTPLTVFARFSSGETWYSPVEDSRRKAA